MTDSLKNTLCAGALLALCLLVFGNTLGHEFVYDDMKTIVNNPHISDFGGNLPHFFDRTFFVISGGEASYRPLPTLSYFVLHQIFGADPLGYHLFSLLLHGANAALVFMLLLFLQSRRWVAFSAAMLFLVHPVVTEAVNCVSFNEDLLATFFFLTALIAAVRSGSREGSTRLWLELVSWTSFALALLSKEMALTLPLVVILQVAIFKTSPESQGVIAHLFTKLRARFRIHIGYLVVMFGYLYLRFYLLVSTSGPVTDGVPLLKRLVFIPAQVLVFLKPIVFPFHLSAEYVHAYPGHFWDPVNLMALLLVAGLVFCGWLMGRKNAAVSFGIGWFLVTLAPVLNLYELINPVAERYLYLPMIGVATAIVSALAVALPVDDAVRSKWAHRISGVIIAVLVVGLGISTYKRNSIWHDNFTLFSETVKRVPGSPRVRGGLGLAYQQMGRLPEAAREFQRAIELNPKLVNAHFSLGNMYEQAGRTEEAIAAYEQAAALDPDFLNVQFNLAGLYVKRGRLEDALNAYTRHLRSSPKDIEARNNLGVVYAMLGRLADAEDQWRKVLVTAPDNQNARANLKKLKAMSAGERSQ